MEEPQKPNEAPEATEQPQQPASSESGSPQPQAPQQPSSVPTPQPVLDKRTAMEQADLNSARTLATVATIGGPVSFIIGGVALSTVAVVCAAIAFSKVNKVLKNTSSPMYNYAKVLKQTAVMGLFIGAVALILNVVGMVTMLPKIMEAMQSGDLSSIIGSGTTGSSTNSAPSSGGESAWG